MPDNQVAASIITERVLEQFATAKARPLFVGICGAQGSGKSTVSAQVRDALTGLELRCAVLSIDDLYLPKADRLALARDVHPLLATRGPPGTHDLALGAGVFADLKAGRPTSLPVFDKSTDDREAPDLWIGVPGPVDIVLFEGWCVGARRQHPSQLGAPLNALEEIEDEDQTWRHYVNQCLARDYEPFFAALDYLVLLAAPNFEVVETWRRQQEHGLIARLSLNGRRPSGVMTDDQIHRFIQFYERLTRHILSEMPQRADLTLKLDFNRQVQTEAFAGRSSI